MSIYIFYAIANSSCLLKLRASDSNVVKNDHSVVGRAEGALETSERCYHVFSSHGEGLSSEDYGGASAGGREGVWVKGVSGLRTEGTGRGVQRRDNAMDWSHGASSRYGTTLGKGRADGGRVRVVCCSRMCHRSIVVSCSKAVLYFCTSQTLVSCRCVVFSSFFMLHIVTLLHNIISLLL